MVVMKCIYCGNSFWDEDVVRAVKVFKYRIVAKKWVQLVHLVRGECYGNKGKY